VAEQGPPARAHPTTGAIGQALAGGSCPEGVEQTRGAQEAAPTPGTEHFHGGGDGPRPGQDVDPACQGPWLGRDVGSWRPALLWYWLGKS